MAKPKLPQTLSMGRNFLFCLFFVFSKFLPPWPKNAPKLMETQKKQTKKVSPRVASPASPQTFSMGRNFCFFWFSRGLCPLAQECPKTHGKNKKNKNVSPHVTCPASPQTLSMGRNCLFFWFSRGFCHLVSPTMSVAHFFVFFVFLFLGFLGDFHPAKHPLAQLSLLHILYWCLHWVTDFGYWAIRENVQ